MRWQSFGAGLTICVRWATQQHLSIFHLFHFLLLSLHDIVPGRHGGQVRAWQPNPMHVPIQRLQAKGRVMVSCFQQPI